jgi:uncharacterized protein (DUF2147 family)
MSAPGKDWSVKRVWRTAGTLCLGLMPIALTAQAGSVLGTWQDPTGSVIRIDRCGTEVCLWIVALGPTAPSTADIHNPDPGARMRALCGLKIGSGFTLRDAGHASGGSLYDPKTGKTYHGMMSAENGNLELRGYVGISLFGRSETWKRPAKPVQPCQNPR